MIRTIPRSHLASSPHPHLPTPLSPPSPIQLFILADEFTYTSMIANCMGQQDLGRALELAQVVVVVWVGAGGWVGGGGYAVWGWVTHASLSLSPKH